ncbi:hypothetical protein [Candidatus Enterococcus ferrettii]|uniref:Uncharacterized protein n=1 Tax=Candidatus Enterococcus ferrettii TaxID=2815324 RepID=A0ABV0EKT1_9ENTE|nr:hypothetical protein [Enterococcus sp. 665A]MBO1342297.1 hypothetical protein [Enterococcus sp. 665A]
MKLVTEYFDLKLKQKDVDFIDINMEGDSKLFINPILLTESIDEDISLMGPKKVDSFFERVFTLYSDGKQAEALSTLFSHSKESNANHLGYSSGESKGNGASKQSLDQLFDTILKTGALAEDIMVQPVSILVFAHDFGQDRMSDLIVSILKKEFVSYTLSEARKLGIPIEVEEISYGEYWDCDTSTWKELRDNWVKGADGKALILTPKQIVSQKYGFSVNDYVRKAVWVWRKDHHVAERTPLARPQYDKNGNVSYIEPTNETLKVEEIDKPYANKDGKWKLYALEMTIENPQLYSQYFDKLNAEGWKNRKTSLTDDELVNIVKESR